MKTIHALALALFTAAVAFTQQVLPNAEHKPLPAEKFTEAFTKVSPQSIQDKLFHHGAFLLTGGKAEGYNSMTVGWSLFGILWGKPMAQVFVRDDRFTFQFMEKDEIFTLSWYGDAYRQSIMRVYGHKSGRDTDKEKETSFTPVVTPDGGVTYLQADRVLVCRRVLRTVLDAKALPVPPPKAASLEHPHVQYTAEVLSVWTRKQPAPQQ